MRAKILVLSATLVLSANLYAQVTIGSVNAPKAGAILDLNSGAKGGLVLSNVSLDNTGEIPAGFPGMSGAEIAVAKAQLKGAMVYNTNPNTCVGVHAWDGNHWSRPISPQKSTGSPLTITSNWTNAVGGDNIEFAVDIEAKTYTWYINPNTGYEYLGVTTEPKLEVAVPAGTVKLKVIADNCHVLEESNEAIIPSETLSPKFGSTEGGNTIYIYGDFPYAATDEYVQDRLVAHYDGINNTGEGDKYHSNTTDAWKNLMGNVTLPDGEMCLDKACTQKGQDARLSWTNNSAYFGANDGVWFRINKYYNPQNYTLEVVYRSYTVVDYLQDLVANWHNGGFGFAINGSYGNQHAGFTVFVNGSYRYSTPVHYDLGEIQSLSAQYFDYGSSGCAVATYVNGVGNVIPILTTTCTLTPPTNNTVWSIGANPKGDSITDEFLQESDIYSVRIYDKKLSEEDIIKNSKLDKIRYLDPPKVKIGNNFCTEVVVLSSHFLMCKVPKSTSGTTREDVEITSDGNPPLVLDGAYQYVNAVSDFYISSISPIIGEAGMSGQELTLKGNELTQITEVQVGGQPCTLISPPSATEYKCELPNLSAGEVDIIIITSSKTYRFAKVFEYK